MWVPWLRFCSSFFSSELLCLVLLFEKQRNKFDELCCSESFRCSSFRSGSDLKLHSCSISRIRFERGDLKGLTHTFKLRLFSKSFENSHASKLMQTIITSQLRYLFLEDRCRFNNSPRQQRFDFQFLFEGYRWLDCISNDVAKKKLTTKVTRS